MYFSITVHELSELHPQSNLCQIVVSVSYEFLFCVTEILSSFVTQRYALATKVITCIR